MTKKQRIDSAHVAAKAFSDALRDVPVPDCVEIGASEMPFWRIITEARAEWTTVDLIHAANLSRCLASIEENQRLLKAEGDVLENARGTPVMNPRFTVLEQLSRRAVSLSSKIQVHAAATMGEAKLARGKNSAKRDARDTMADIDDELIARPN